MSVTKQTASAWSCRHELEVRSGSRRTSSLISASAYGVSSLSVAPPAFDRDEAAFWPCWIEAVTPVAVGAPLLPELYRIAFEERLKIHDVVLEGIDIALRRRGYGDQ